jgi:hypothetical protein
MRLLQRRLVHRAASGLLLVLRVLHVDELAADQHVVGVSLHSDRGGEEECLLAMEVGGEVQARLGQAGRLSQPVAVRPEKGEVV